MDFKDLFNNLKDVFLSGSDGWNSKIYKAAIFHIGNDLYYLGNKEHDLTRLDDSFYIRTNHKKYAIKEAVRKDYDNKFGVVFAKLIEIKE